MFIASAASQNINIPAQVPVTPVARAQPVVENILNAPANLLISGQMRFVLVRQHINTPVPALDIQAGQARLVMVNIQSVHVKVDTLGAAENVLNNHLQVLAVLQEEVVVGVLKLNAMIIQCIAELKVGNVVSIDFVGTRIVAMEKLIWDVKPDILRKRHVAMQFLAIHMF